MTEYSMLERLCGTLCRAIGRVPLSEVALAYDYAQICAYADLRELHEKQLNRLKELYGVEV